MKEVIQRFNFERKEEKKDNVTAKEKIKEIFKKDKFTKEEIREILRDLHVMINPNIEENIPTDKNNPKNGKDNISSETPKIFLNEIRDNGITPCDKKEKKEKKKKGKEKENIIQKEIEKKYSKIYQKIYGFRNHGNNCYLNSSLQLLTRIRELKVEVFNFKENYKDNDTHGQLIIEFRKLLTLIENSDEDNFILDPRDLKRIMGNVDSKYFSNAEEDSNEFIANFLKALLSETGNKEIPLQKLNIVKELDKKPYESLFKKFFKKRGDSFVINLFYGIYKTTKFCKNCGEINSIKFNVYNMLNFQLFALVENIRKKELTFNELYKNYLSEVLIEDDSCSFCNSNKLYAKSSVYTFPKYLMICLQRSNTNEYCDNKVIYPKNLKMKGEYENSESSYILDCVIEHSGGVGYGHYTALIPMDKDNNIWWRFSDSSWNRTNVGYQSDNAFILLYKLN